MSNNFLMHLEKTPVALYIKAAVAVIATIMFFQSDLAILLNDALQNETASYILAIPFLFAFFLYRKRKMLRAVVPLGNKSQPKETRHLPLIAGIILFLTSVLLYWHGSYTFTPLEYHILALPIFAAALTLIFFNLQTLRQLIFPIAFLALLSPPPPEVLYNFGATLSVISAETSNAFMRMLGFASTITSEYGNPTILLTRSDGTAMAFTVDIACSGIYSLFGFLTFALFIAYIIRDKTWKKLALITIGIPLVYLLNIIRITIILLIGYYYGAELALQMFHLVGGWVLIFLGTLLLLTISEKVFKTQMFSNPSGKCKQCNSVSSSEQRFCLSCGRILKPATATLQRTDIVKIVAVASAVILLISIQAPVFALTQGPPIVVVTNSSEQQISTEILPKVPDYNLSFVYRDEQFEAKAKQDFSLVYLYETSDEARAPIWVTMEIAPTRSSLHRWEVCLITWPMSHGYQPKVTQIELKDVQLTENPPIISRYFVFQYKATNETQAVLYWYETTTFKVNSTIQQKNVKISLIAYPESLEELPKIENQMITLATAIANYWQPIKTWSQITMLISQYGKSLAAVTSVTLAAIIALYIMETRRQRKANARAYQKLSKLNRQIIDIVRETEKRTTPTLENIAETYQKTTRQNINKNQLLQKLTELEKTSIIKCQITNKQDEPVQIWRVQI